LKKVQETISGTVTDAQTGDPLVGVNILVVGTSNGMATDADGHYSLKVTSLRDTLRFSYIGYKTRTIPINGRTRVDVSLKSSITGLKQLVVTGFGTVKQQDVTSSISSVSSKEIESSPAVSADQLLQGKAPGVFISRNSGTPGGSTHLRIRGTTSITASNSPLYIVDGVPIASGNDQSIGLDQGLDALSSISPSMIASMSILKGAVATARYGTRGANGVVIITTKQGKNKEKERFNFSYSH